MRTSTDIKSPYSVKSGNIGKAKILPLLWDLPILLHPSGQKSAFSFSIPPLWVCILYACKWLCACGCKICSENIITKLSYVWLDDEIFLSMFLILLYVYVLKIVNTHREQSLVLQKRKREKERKRKKEIEDYFGS